MRNLRILDVSLVSCVEEDERIVLQCVLHPFLQCLLCGNGASRIIWKTEVYHVHTLLWWQRSKIIFCIARHVYHVVPSTIFQHASPAYHHVRVDIDGINRVSDADRVIPAEEFLEVSCITFRAIIDKDLARINVNATCKVVILHYGIAQKLVSLLRTISPESVFMPHFIDCLVHGFHHSRAQWLGHVSDTETYHLDVWMRSLKRIHLFGYVCKQIIVWQFQEMFVY